jgi:hypothetical protein
MNLKTGETNCQQRPGLADVPALAFRLLGKLFKSSVKNK